MAERPVVIARLGAYCEDPEGLYDALADHYDASHLVPVEIHDDLYGKGAGGRNTRSHTRAVDRRMMDLTEQALEGGKSVIYDASVDNPKKRNELWDLAEDLRVPVVLLHTPVDEAVIFSRVRHRFANDKLYVPKEEEPLKTHLNLARWTIGYTRNPEVDPDQINLEHLCIDGLSRVGNIIPQVDEYIADLRS